MKKSIAFFDFDGTITTKDTLLEVIKYQKGTLSFLTGFLLHLPALVSYKIGIISNQAAKERILRHFFGQMPADLFQQKCDQFAAQLLPKLLRPKASAELQKHKDNGTEVVIVSASAGNWIQDWTKANGYQLIATQLEVVEGRLTGKIKGLNCHGDEKVNRIRASYDLSGYDEVYCYGDTKGDLPMLSLAHFRFYKPFRD